MVKKLNPQISIIMAVYNAEKYFRESIESILNQTFTDFEFIIINDGSTDRSLQIMNSYNDERIIIIAQENQGAAKARNEGIAKAKSNFIAILDADDIAKPERLQKQYKFLINNPDFVAVGSNADIIDMKGNYIYCSSLPLTDDEMRKVLPNFPTFHPSLMFKKDSFFKTGGYPNFMLKGQDLVMFNRIAAYGKITNLSEPLIKYRIVPTANSDRDSKVSSRFNDILEKAIKYNKISKKDSVYLQEQISNRNSKLRLANYHLYLAKKYLWNNYQPKLARKNLIKSLKIRFNKISVFYYFVSFLPEKIIKILYTMLKNR